MRAVVLLAMSLIALTGCNAGRPAAGIASLPAEPMRIRPGQVWADTEGRPIQAHAGGMLHHADTYYWYGQNMAGPTIDNNRVDIVGISCYSSRDLYNWKNEGLVLTPVPDDHTHDLHPSRVCERPKVIYNARTDRFVMWVHVDDAGYCYARAGVAVSDRPTGPFSYMESFRPNGEQCRDLTLFKDDDNKAYLIFGGGWHTHIQIAELTDDYLRPSGVYSRHFENPGPPTGREAPAMFKHSGRYYLITSGTTGWSPNPAMYATAESIHGPWAEKGNPCVGPNSRTTFHSQSTYVLPVAARPGTFIFMADRWNNEDLGDSRYVWLPVQFTPGGIKIEWMDEWKL